MFHPRLCRALLVLAAASASISAALLAGCGASTVVSALSPSKIVSFGDGFSDLGQVAGKRYTVNDGSINVWVQQVAFQFGLTMSAQASGGTGYAQGAARVTSAVDGMGGAAPSITQQIGTYLATNTPGSNDILVVDGGLSDITANSMRYFNYDAALTAALGGPLTQQQMTDNIKQAGTELGAQVRRLVAAGAQHVVVVSAINLGNTPWGVGISQTAVLTDATSAFNDALLVSIVDLGSKVLYVDASYYFNLVSTSPATYSLINAAVPACDPATTTDPTEGIGIGAGRINSSLCGPGNVLAGQDYATYVFADQVYPTPVAHRLLAGYVYDRVRNRW